MVVFSLVQPAVNYPVVDKLIAGCELAGIDPLICISKADLAEPDALAEALAVYSDIYPSVSVNGITGEGVEDLRQMISGKKVALAGPSGVGKSTITNLLHAGEPGGVRRYLHRLHRQRHRLSVREGGLSRGFCAEARPCPSPSEKAYRGVREEGRPSDYLRGAGAGV